MIPYPIEEMRKFILKEYPNLNNMLHPDYKAGALMSAILRWWTDEQQPEIENLRKQVAALQEIAVSERANTLFNGPWDGGLPVEASYDATMAKAKEDARDQLAEKHPEAFR
jgi:hypothetical protein